MQKTVQQLEAEADRLIDEFDWATRGLFKPDPVEGERHLRECVQHNNVVYLKGAEG